MQAVQVRGLVLRSVDLRESDRLITVFTRERGVMTALARGARSLKSRQMSSTLPFCYSELTLYARGDKFWIKEASLIESFFHLRDTLEGLALAGYVAEAIGEIAIAEPDEELLRLALNTLYAIAGGLYPLPHIKAAFEMRAAAVAGFMPDVLSCDTCGERADNYYFDILGGHIQCYACHEQAAQTYQEPSSPTHAVCLLTEGARAALAYSIYSPLERLFSFRVAAGDQDSLTVAAESYLLNHLERSFPSLEFYKEVTR